MEESGGATLHCGGVHRWIDRRVTWRPYLSLPPAYNRITRGETRARLGPEVQTLRTRETLIGYRLQFGSGGA